MSIATTGMSDKTGQQIHYHDHLRQSINRILTTPVGSCVVRREFGSYLFELIDSATNADGLQRLRAAAAQALIRWEPRLVIERVDIVPDAEGRVQYIIVGSSEFGAVTFGGELFA